MTAAFKKIRRFTTFSLHKRGFTIPEVMVALVLIALLASVVIFIINPQEQIKKARDAKRKDDIQAIHQALGKYSVETGGYPKSTADYQIVGAGWGSSWDPYIIPVPKDPLLSQSYAYYSDGAFYQLYAKLEIADPAGCGSCGPGGEYNWSVASSNSKPSSLPPASSPIPSPSPSPTPQPSPQPSPITQYQGDLTVFVSTPNNPQMMRVVISPFDPTVGANQTITLSVRDTSGTPITGVLLTVLTDNRSNNYQMSLQSGSNTNGVWAASFTVTDTHETRYEIRFLATNQNGLTSTNEIPLESSLRNLRAQ